VSGSGSQSPRERYAAARPPAGSTPWRSARYCAVDLELTGLDPRRHEIVSFGAVPLADGRVQLGGAISGPVRPRGGVDEEAIRVHGLRPADLLDAPRLETALEPLLGPLAGAVAVAHFADVEREFLGRALKQMTVRMRNPFVDTAVLGALWLSERDDIPPRKLPLGELAEALGLPSHRPHHALGDALTTAQVFLALATHLDAHRPQTVNSLAKAEGALRTVRLYPPAG
jgi:DNA polymerase-3 subunit epsilon